MPRTKFRRRRSYRRTRPMVSRKRYGKYNRRRSYGRRRLFKSVCSPQKVNVKLRYLEVASPNFPGAASTFAFKEYRLNSAFDVASALGNTSTPGFAEWAAFYKFYRVNMAVMQVTFYNPSTSPCYVGIWAAPLSQTNLTTWSDFMETTGNPYSKRYLLGSQGSGSDRVTLKIVAPLGRLVGNKIRYTADALYSSATTTSPTNICPGYVFVASNDGTSNTGVIMCDIRITQYVTFFDRIILVS